MTELAPTEISVGASSAGFEPGTEGITPPTDPSRHGVFLADVIVELGFADQDQVDAADRASRETEKPIETVLIGNGTLDERQLSRVIAERNGLDHVDLDRFNVDMGAAELVGRSVAGRYKAVPIAFAPDGALIVAVEDVFDTLGISDIEVLTRSEVRRVVAAPGELQALIDQLPAEPPHSPPSPPAVPPSPPEAALSEPQEPQFFDTVDSPGPPSAQPSPEIFTEEVLPPPPPVPVPLADIAPVERDQGPLDPPGGPEEDSLIPPDEQADVPEPDPPADVPEPDPPADVPEPDPPADILESDEPEEESPEPGSELRERPLPPFEPEEEPMQPFETEKAPLPPFQPEEEPMQQFEAEEATAQPEPQDQYPVPEAPPSEPIAPSDDELADLVAELRALRETASRADALAISVGNRIEALEGAEDRADRLEREQAEREERISQLERDLAAALATTAELEGKLSGVADAAEELNAATETLRGLQRALEQTAR